MEADEILAECANFILDLRDRYGNSHNAVIVAALSQHMIMSKMTPLEAYQAVSTADALTRLYTQQLQGN